MSEISDTLRLRAAFFQNEDYCKTHFPAHLIRPLGSELLDAANKLDDALAAIETAWKEGYMARANEEGEEYRCGMEWGRAEERERALCWAKKFAATSRAGYLHFRPLFEAIEQGQPLPTQPTGDENGNARTQD